jgi:hypothetical protein
VKRNALIAGGGILVRASVPAANEPRLTRHMAMASIAVRGIERL